MKRTLWAVGEGVALVAVIAAAGAMLEKSANAQATRQQVPLFEPDPLWSEALPNKW